MRVAITGVNGFVGRHLARELVAAGHGVVGMGLGPVAAEVAGLLTDYLSVDLARRWPNVEVDGVVHLAALSAVGPSFANPQHYIEANSAPVTHLGEWLVGCDRRVRLVAISTGAVYGANNGRPLAEDAPLVPTSPYVVSKILTESQCAYYRRRGADVVVMRPFNHIGPGQSGGFVLPDLVAGVRRWVADGTALRVGNLQTCRDYTDVRDVVRAYRLALEAPEILEPILNVCSSRSVTGRSLLDTVADVMHVPTPECVVDPALLRPDDPMEVRGDRSRIERTLGWQPSFDLSRSVRDLVAGSPEGADS